MTENKKKALLAQTLNLDDTRMVNYSGTEWSKGPNLPKISSNGSSIAGITCVRVLCNHENMLASNLAGPCQCEDSERGTEEFQVYFHCNL